MPHRTAPGRVLITGGGAGLGAAIARAIAADGGEPVVIDRVVPAGTSFETYEADVSDTRELERLIGDVADRGGLGGLVTAAGIDRPGRLDRVAPDEWERVIGVNLLGTVAAVRAALP